MATYGGTRNAVGSNRGYTVYLAASNSGSPYQSGSTWYQNVAWSVTIDSASYSFYGYTLGYQVNVEGSQVAYHANSGAQTSMNKGDTWKAVISGTTAVAYNANGTKNFSIYVRVFTDNVSYLPYNIEGTLYFDLPVHTITCSISYNANGGSGAPGSQTYTYATSGVTYLSSTIPTRTNYNFLGWSLSSSASSPSYYAGQSWNLNNLGDYTLYAVWQIKPTYQLSIWPGIGTYNGSGSVQTFSGIQGSTTYVGFASPPTGYVFAGYYTTSGNLTGLSSYDACFENGTTGGVNVYNNSGNGTVTITREQDNTVPNVGHGNGSVGYRLKIAKSTGTASPYCGGFYLSTQSVANQVYRCFIWAKIPKGYRISDYRNSIGDGGYSTWLTEQQGTGDWFAYVYEVHTGSSGSFSNFGHVAINANNGDNNSAVTWYVCATQITNITNNLIYTYNSTASIECYYAPLKYTISYSLDGGSASNPTEYNITTATFTLNNPTKSGYTFQGWTGSNGSTAQTLVSIAKGSTGNKSYTANWLKNTYSISLSSKTINSIIVTSSSNVTISSTQYRIKTSTGDYGSYQSNGTFSDLTPNTEYTIEVRMVVSSTGDVGIATLSITTYNYAELTSVPNFNHGDNETITYTNPSGSKIETIITLSTDETVLITSSYRTITGSSYTYVFTDTELDKLYKLYGDNNIVQLKMYLRTTCNNVKYYDTKIITCTLTGNQKTIHYGVNNIPKRGKMWYGVNGVPKRAVLWYGVNGVPKRTI